MSPGLSRPLLPWAFESIFFNFIKAVVSCEICEHGNLKDLRDLRALLPVESRPLPGASKNIVTEGSENTGAQSIKTIVPWQIRERRYLESWNI